MPLRAIFLDLGGTLMDPESDRRAHREMMKALGDAAGLSSDPEEMLSLYTRMHEERLQGLGTTWRSGDEITREVVASMLRREGIVMTEGHWRAFLRAYWREHLRWLRLFPEALEVLEALRVRRHHLGLISDIDEDFLQMCFWAFPIEGYFDSITTSDEVGVAKPHETIFKRALSKAMCAPQEAVYVGDSPERDALGAAAVGLPSILVTRERGRFTADYVVSDLWEAYRVLDDLIQGDEP